MIWTADNMSLTIRHALATDVEAITEIYNEAIATTTATFDTEPKSVSDRMQWFDSHDARHPILVAVLDDKVVGWSSVNSWSDRRAYDDTAETSFYVKSEFRGRGIGRKLKEATIEEARRLRFHSLIARIAEGGDESLHLNESMGFAKVGTLKEVGRKFGKLLDVHILQKLLLVVLIFLPVAALSQVGTSWSPKGFMPYERSEIAIATVNGKIYVISGQGRGLEANAINQEYDPATGQWRDLAPMPAVASHAGAAVLNGKIYVVGGFVANVHVGAVNRVFEYDPAADRWRALAPLAAPRGSPGVVVLNGKIHAIGGRDPDRKTVATHEVYDPATNAWSMAAPLPLARDHLGIAVATGRIHVFGGRTEATVDNTARHDVYDPATNTWSMAAPLITARSAGASVALDGRIVYTGGECKDPTASVTFSEVEAYDPRTDRWMSLPPLQPGRHAAAAVAVGNQAYLFGGNTGCGGMRPSKEVLSFRMP